MSYAITLPVGAFELSMPSEAQVLAFEDARRQLYRPAPLDAPLASPDNGREQVLAVITSPERAKVEELLGEFPGLVGRFGGLALAFREAGGDGMGIERDDSAMTDAQRLQYKKRAFGLRCFGVPLVIRKIGPERYTLLEVAAARGDGLSFQQIRDLAKEHIVSPLGEELDALTAQHPYLLINLGNMLTRLAQGREADLLGKLPSASSGSAMTSSPPPAASLPPASASAGAPAATPMPSPAPSPK